MEYSIYLTTNCNFECAYCYENSDICNLQTMSREMLIKTIDDIFIRNTDGLYYIKFFGGEPLLALDNITFAVDYIKRTYSNKGIVCFLINTNGSLLTDEVIDFFKVNNFHVKISLDGDHYNNNLNRKSKNGSDMYYDILNQAIKLKERNIKNSIRMTVTANTLSSLFSNVAYLYECGFKDFCIGLDFTHCYTDQELSLYEHELEKLADFYLEILKRNETISIDVFSGQFSKFIFDFESKFIMCGGGIYSFRYMPDGNVYPCNLVCGDSKFCIGNVSSGISIKRIMPVITSCMKKDTECLKCDIAFYCHYMKCGYANYLNTGFFNLPSTQNCAIQKTTYKIVESVFDYIATFKPQMLSKYISYAAKNNIKLRKEVEFLNSL